MTEKPRTPGAKRSSLLTGDDLAMLRAMLREQNQRIDAIRAARDVARSQGRPVLFATVGDIPMSRAERHSMSTERARSLAVAELLRRIDERKEIGAAAGKRRAISDEQKADWLVAAEKLRKRNRYLSMTAIFDAIGREVGVSGRTVRKYLSKFWERS